jgi:hypothetical protein
MDSSPSRPRVRIVTRHREAVEGGGARGRRRTECSVKGERRDGTEGANADFKRIPCCGDPAWTFVGMGNLSRWRAAAGPALGRLPYV